MTIDEWKKSGKAMPIALRIKTGQRHFNMQDQQELDDLQSDSKMLDDLITGLLHEGFIFESGVDEGHPEKYVFDNGASDESNHFKWCSTPREAIAAAISKWRNST